MEITGQIQSIGETQRVSDRFQKRDFIIVTDQNTDYPQYIPLEFQQDKCDIIDAYEVGQEVIVNFNLKGRQWQDQQGRTKTFVTLAAWKIQPLNK